MPSFSTLEDYNNLDSDGGTFSNPEDKFWSRYLAIATERDEKMTTGWKGDTDGLIIYAGLLSATIAALIPTSFSLLTRDSASDTVSILLELLELQRNFLANETAATFSSQAQNITDIAADIVSPFTPSSLDIAINVLWLYSLVLSLFCALAATMVQQWCRQYAAKSRVARPPHKRGPLHCLYSMGMEKFGFRYAVDAIVVILHFAVGYFIIGLLLLASQINATIAYALIIPISCGSAAHLVLTIIPLFDPACPYGTPFTPSFRIPMYLGFSMAEASSKKLREMLGTLSLLPRWGIYEFPVLQYLSEKLGRSGQRILEDRVMELSHSDDIVQYALTRTYAETDQDSELEELLDALPILLHSPVVSSSVAIFASLGNFSLLDKRISKLISTCDARLGAHLSTKSRDMGTTLSNRPVALSSRERLRRLSSLSIFCLDLPKHIPTPICDQPVSTVKLQFPSTLASWTKLCDPRDINATFFAFIALHRLGAPVLSQPCDTEELWITVTREEIDFSLITQIPHTNKHRDYVPLLRILLFIRVILLLAKQPSPPGLRNPVDEYYSLWSEVLNRFSVIPHKELVPYSSQKRRDFEFFLRMLGYSWSGLSDLDPSRQCYSPPSSPTPSKHAEQPELTALPAIRNKLAHIVQLWERRRDVYPPRRT